MSLGLRGKTIVVAAVAEAGTGLALLIDPALVAALIWGAELAVVAPVLARCFGIALLAFSMACWPGWRGERGRGGGTSAMRAMLVYNALLALYLAYLGAVLHLAGLLLWPAVVFHAGVALMLAWPAHRLR